MGPLDSVIAMVMRLGAKSNLTEFEYLLYEQACRYLETMLKVSRENLERVTSESENPNK